MNKAKYWILFLVVLLVGSNAYWVYQNIDKSVTLMYADSSLSMSNDMLKESLRLANMNLVGRTLSEAKQMVGKDVHGFEPYEKEGCLFVGQICLKLDASEKVAMVEIPYQ